MAGAACVGRGFGPGGGWDPGVVTAVAWVCFLSAGAEIAAKADETLSPVVFVSSAFTSCLAGESVSETERVAKAIKAATRKRLSAARGRFLMFMKG